MCSFSDDEFSSVVLEEGKLSFIPANEKSKTYKLLPEDQLLVLEETGEVIQRKTDVQKHIAWTNGKLIFRNDPLSEVITRLNRWYNADITLDDPNNELGEHPFTLTIHNETLPQVIEFITQAADLHATKINADGPIDGILQKSKYIIN